LVLAELQIQQVQVLQDLILFLALTRLLVVVMALLVMDQILLLVVPADQAVAVLQALEVPEHPDKVIPVAQVQDTTALVAVAVELVELVVLQAVTLVAMAVLKKHLVLLVILMLAEATEQVVAEPVADTMVEQIPAMAAQVHMADQVELEVVV
jgi:hypothetical protein